MGIRDSIVRWLGATPAVKASSWRTLWMSGNEGSINGITLPDTPTGWRMAARMVWAANAIDARAKAVSQATLGLYEPGDKSQEDAEDGAAEVAHPALDLLASPNPVTLDGVSLLGALERQLSLYGDCLVRVVRGSRDDPSELEMLSPEAIELQRDDRGFVLGFIDRMHGWQYPTDDVVRVHYPSDYDPFAARSPMSSAVDSINRYLLADFAQQAIDRRGGQGGGIVSVNLSQTLDEERFKAEWDAIRSDPRNAGRDAFVPPGTDYKSGVLTAQQQQREERIARLRKEILAGLNVPPACAGDYSDASVLANADLQWKQFWQGWVVPECDMIARRLTRSFLWRYWPDTKERGLYFAFDYSNIPALQQSEGEAMDVENKRAARAVSLWSGKVVSCNEAREMVGLDPIDDPRADEVLPEEQPAAQSAPADALADHAQPAPAPDAAIQTQALNGAQVQSLVEIAGAVSAGTLAPTAAAAIIQAAFPLIQPDAARLIVSAQAKIDPPSTQPNADQTSTDQAPPQDGANATVTPQPEVSAKTLVPVIDFVGMTATDAAGERIGVIERIHRFGTHDGLTATKAEPVVVIDGRAWPARDIRVALGGDGG